MFLKVFFLHQATVLECCRRHLQATEQKTCAVLSSLVAIVMLENCTLRQVFSQFLLAQKVRRGDT